MSPLPFGVARGAEHRDVTGIGRRHVSAVSADIKPIVVVGLPLVRDRTPLSNPKIKLPQPYSASYQSRFTKEQVQKAARMTANLHRLGHKTWRSLIAQDCINQTKKASAFALADKLLGNLEAHPAAEGVARQKIGAMRLHPSNLADVIGSHLFDCASDAVLAIQRRWLKAKNRTVALKIAEKMAVVDHEAIKVVHEEKRRACSGRAERHQ